MTARVLAGDWIGSTAAGVSAGAALSGSVERRMNASNVSATPPGSAIQTRLRKAEKIGPRDFGRAGRAGEAVAAACRATAISPTRGSHRSVRLCPTTRSRAPSIDEARRRSSGGKFLGVLLSTCVAG